MIQRHNTNYQKHETEESSSTSLHEDSEIPKDRRAMPPPSLSLPFSSFKPNQNLSSKGEAQSHQEKGSAQDISVIQIYRKAQRFRLKPRSFLMPFVSSLGGVTKIIIGILCYSSF